MNIFSIHIEMNNSAFEDDTELPRILRTLSKRLETDRNGEGYVFDINGNKVGMFVFTNEQRDSEYDTKEEG